jgi:hypothetical protein
MVQCIQMELVKSRWIIQYTFHHSLHQIRRLERLWIPSIETEKVIYVMYIKVMGMKCRISGPECPCENWADSNL